MKLKITAVLLTIHVLFFFSCNKNKSPQNAQGGSAIGGESVNPAFSGKYGFVLRVNASFYTLENDTGSESDKTKWAAQMVLGESVAIGETRRVTFGGDGKVYDFVEVSRSDGNKGFAWASHISNGGSLAVVIDEKANLFKSPGTVNVTTNTISRKTVVVCFTETERDGFVEIKGYDPISQVTRQNYMRLSSLSARKSDIQSSILLQTAEPLKNEGPEKVRRDALLEAALLDYPDSVFSAEIQALVNPNAAAVINTESVSRSFMSVNDNNVNVRNLPDVVAGKVIGHLDNDDEVTVTERTVSEFTIEGQRARWYHITEPLEGWVFGIYLD